jgi:ABC-type branched-subunit amino acid transport system substrate-binding protein
MSDELTIKEQIEMEIMDSFRDISSTMKKIRANKILLDLELTDTLRDITTILDKQLRTNNMVIATWHEEDLKQ